MKMCPLTCRSPGLTQSDTQMHAHSWTYMQTHVSEPREGCSGVQNGVGGKRTGTPAGHHFLLLLGAVGSEVLGDDVCILEEHITDGLGRTQRVGETRGWG